VSFLTVMIGVALVLVLIYRSIGEWRNTQETAKRD
jgi:hypothetical protein